MAEQAVNTIYALGDHPDTLCNELIKGLARKAFGGQTLGGRQDPTRPSTPDAMETDTVSGGEQDGDPLATPRAQSTQQSVRATSTSGAAMKGEAFELSQLLFVVGHVAMKQIVYLELVEREWKRQKDEKEKGMLFCS